MIRFQSNKLEGSAKRRKPGYLEAVLQASTKIDDNTMEMSKEDYLRIKEEFCLGGPGFELKKLLKLFGIIPEPGCQCNKRAAYMDQMGCQWCRDNIDTILGWLQEEANKRGLLFVKSVARMVVYRAIVNTESVANKE